MLIEESYFELLEQLAQRFVSPGEVRVRTESQRRVWERLRRDSDRTAVNLLADVLFVGSVGEVFSHGGRGFTRRGAALERRFGAWPALAAFSNDLEPVAGADRTFRIRSSPPHLTALAGHGTFSVRARQTSPHSGPLAQRSTLSLHVGYVPDPQPTGNFDGATRALIIAGSVAQTEVTYQESQRDARIYSVTVPRFPNLSLPLYAWVEVSGTPAIELYDFQFGPGSQPMEYLPRVGGGPLTADSPKGYTRHFARGYQWRMVGKRVLGRIHPGELPLLITGASTAATLGDILLNAEPSEASPFWGFVCTSARPLVWSPFGRIDFEQGS